MKCPSVRVDPAGVRPFLEKLFESAGLPAEQAAVVSENLFEAEMRGVYSHGLSLALLDADFAPGAVSGRRTGRPAPAFSAMRGAPEMRLFR